MLRPELAEELERLAAEDLAMRERLVETGELYDGYHPEMRSLHRRNGDRLAVILAELGGWPGHRQVGEAGSKAAWLIAQHDIANPAGFRRNRDLYEVAVVAGDADPVGLAPMVDRIRYFEGQPQRYGTQLGWDTNGELAPWPPVEDPETVDARRAKVGLPPLADAIGAAEKAGRGPIRSAAEVVKDRRAAEEFARQVGWRDDTPS